MLPLLSRRAQDLPHFSANLASIFSTATAKVWNVFWSMPPSPTETWPSNRAKKASFAFAPPGLFFSGLLERDLERLRRPLLRDRLRSFWLMHLLIPPIIHPFKFFILSRGKLRKCSQISIWCSFFRAHRAATVCPSSSHCPSVPLSLHFLKICRARFATLGSS